MNIKITLRLLAVVAIATPAVRLLAAPSEMEQEQLANRSMQLEALGQDARERSARETLSAAQQREIAKLNLPAPDSFDLNHNKKLDENEFAAWTGALRVAIVKSPTAMKRFDMNHDGKLDDAEWATALGTLIGVQVAAAK